MFKTIVVITTLLMSSFSFASQSEKDSIHIRISSIASTPSSIEEEIVQLARKYGASSWKITSMQFGNNSSATAILYK